jgi:uncharacterized protein YjbI with pentapeptide repeats
MKPMTHNLRQEIRMKIKNNQDISSLIDGVDIRNEDLSYAIITKMNLVDGDISGCNLSYSQLGDKEGHTIFTWINVKVNNCNFEKATFVGKSFVRGCEVKNSNFRGADLSKVDYERSDFTGTTFCDTVLRIGTKQGIGCVFPKEFFEMLVKGWKVDVTVKQ